jgi:predicted nucleic acid-binding Zn ribbon protein
VLPLLRPATTLARVQAAWPGVVGDALAGEAEPVSERGGTVTVRCGSSVWAQELELLSADLLARLNSALTGPADGPLIESLRFVAGGRGPAR